MVKHGFASSRDQLHYNTMTFGTLSLLPRLEKVKVVSKYVTDIGQNLPYLQYENLYWVQMLSSGCGPASSVPAPNLSNSTSTGSSLEASMFYVGAQVSVHPSKVANFVASMHVANASVFSK